MRQTPTQKRSDMWIVMTSRAKMPGSCWGRYGNIALVRLSQYYTSHDLRPTRISSTAKGVLEVVHMGHHNVGKTHACAFNRVLAEAEERAVALNTAAPEAYDDMLMSWGGSA